MIIQNCTISPKSPNPKGYLYTCPEIKEIDCSPVFVTGRPDPDAIPNEFGVYPPIIKCFGTSFTPQEIPANAKCWCGNGFNGNMAAYWIWEPCMATTCIHCPPTDTPTSGFIGGITLYPNCCSIGPSWHPWQDRNDCSGSSPVNPAWNRLCCSPVCQHVRGKSTHRYSDDYIIEVKIGNDNAGSSYIDIEHGKRCFESCCSNAESIKAEWDVYFGAISKIINSGGLAGTIINPIEPNGVNNEPNEIDIGVNNFADIETCTESFTNNTKLKISINMEERSDECYTNELSEFFKERLETLPPIHGAKVKVSFKLPDDTKVEMSALLDIEAINSSTINFQHDQDVTASSDFKLASNSFSDSNYPDIGYYSYPDAAEIIKNHEINFTSLPCPQKSLFHSSKKSIGGLNDTEYTTNITWFSASVTFRFFYYQEKLYMDARHDLILDDSYGINKNTKPIINRVIIEDVSDIYQDFIWGPTDNNINEFKISMNLYG